METIVMNISCCTTMETIERTFLACLQPYYYEGELLDLFSEKYPPGKI
jgi:hypothetical protein